MSAVADEEAERGGQGGGVRGGWSRVGRGRGGGKRHGLQNTPQHQGNERWEMPFEAMWQLGATRAHMLSARASLPARTLEKWRVVPRIQNSNTLRVHVWVAVNLLAPFMDGTSRKPETGVSVVSSPAVNCVGPRARSRHAHANTFRDCIMIVPQRINLQDRD